MGRNKLRAITKKPTSSMTLTGHDVKPSRDIATGGEIKKDVSFNAPSTHSSNLDHDSPLAPGAVLRVPKNVLLYINAYKYALDHDKVLPLASKSIYEFVIANWEHFKGDPSRSDKSKLNLGEEWLSWSGDRFAPEDAEPVSTIGPSKSRISESDNSLNKPQPMTIQYGSGNPLTSSQVPSYYQKPLREPNNPIPQDVMQYIRAHRKALDAQRPLGLPSHQTYTWIMDNWLRFSGDRNQEKATIFDLGEDWYVETRNRLMQDNLSANPQVNWPGSIAPYEISQGRTRYQLLEDMVTGSSHVEPSRIANTSQVAITPQLARAAGVAQKDIEAAEILTMMRAGNATENMTSRQLEWAGKVEELAMINEALDISQLPLSYMRWTGNYLRDGRIMPEDVAKAFNEAIISKYGSLEAMRVPTVQKTLAPLRSFLDLASLPKDMRDWIEKKSADGVTIQMPVTQPMPAFIFLTAEQERQLQHELSEQSRKDAETLRQYNEAQLKKQSRRHAEAKERRQREEQAGGDSQSTIEVHAKAQEEQRMGWAKRLRRLLSYEHILDVPRIMPPDFREWTIKFLRDNMRPPPHIAKVLTEDTTDDQYKRLCECELPGFYVPLESFVDLTKLPPPMVAWLAPAYRSGAIAGVSEPKQALRTRVPAQPRVEFEAEAESLGSIRRETRSLTAKRKAQEPIDDSGFVGGKEDGEDGRQEVADSFEDVQDSMDKEVEDDSGFVEGDSEEPLVPKTIRPTNKRRKTFRESLVNVRTDLKKSLSKSPGKTSSALAQFSSFTAEFTGSSKNSLFTSSFPNNSSQTSSSSIPAGQSAPARKTFVATGARKTHARTKRANSAGSEVPDGVNNDSNKENEYTIKADPKKPGKLTLKRRATDELSQPRNRPTLDLSTDRDEIAFSDDESASQEDPYQVSPAKKPRFTSALDKAIKNAVVAQAANAFAQPKRNNGTRIITGPSKDRIPEMLAKFKAKNNSSRPEDKIWKVEHYPELMTAKRALTKGINVINEPNSQEVKDMLRMRFSLKEDPATILEITYDPPGDWNDPKEITRMIKSMGQNRRREAGSENGTRHAYAEDEVNWLANYFESRPNLHSKKLRGKFWDELAILFNARFENRVSKAIASKAGESGAVGKRSAQALMSICDRSEKILKARKFTPGKGQVVDEQGVEAAASSEPPRKKRGRRAKAAQAAAISRPMLCL